MNRNLWILVVYNTIGVIGLVLSICFWPANFFVADHLSHWILPFALILSIGFMLVGCAFFSKGKGYSLALGALAILGPLGWAILLTIKHNKSPGGNAGQ